MNERINLLAEQATMIKEVNCEGYLGRSYTRQEEYFDKKKFAELIVRECVHTVENRGGMCGALSSNWIKEHFGVEE